MNKRSKQIRSKEIKKEVNKERKKEVTVLN